MKIEQLFENSKACYIVFDFYGSGYDDCVKINGIPSLSLDGQRKFVNIFIDSINKPGVSSSEFSSPYTDPNMSSIGFTISGDNYGTGVDMIFVTSNMYEDMCDDYTANTKEFSSFDQFCEYMKTKQFSDDFSE